MKHPEYTKLGIVGFTDASLAVQDIDSLYVAIAALRGVGVVKDTRIKRFIVAYLALDSLGQGCYLSQYQGDLFWRNLNRAAVAPDIGCPVGGRWEKGGSRGQRTGLQVGKSVDKVEERHPTPEAFIDMASCPTYEQASKRIASHWGWGPWVQFKMCDMIERCLGVPMYFEDKARLCAEPMKGVAALCAQVGVQTNSEVAMAHLRALLGPSRLAPPHNDRRMGVQEFETIFCKWGKHLRGKYPVGADLPLIRASLAKWAPVDEMAANLLSYYDTKIIH